MIRKFENFSIYYKQISCAEFEELRKSPIPIETKIKKIIEDKSKYKTYFILRTISDGYPLRNITRRLDMEVEIPISGEMPINQSHLKLSKLHKIQIVSLPDEWFIVSDFIHYFNRKFWSAPKDDTYYYKCDQIDGLLKLLENEGIINS